MGNGIKAGLLLGRGKWVLGWKATKGTPLVSIADTSPHHFKLYWKFPMRLREGLNLMLTLTSLFYTQIIRDHPTPTPHLTNKETEAYRAKWLPKVAARLQLAVK